MSMKSMGEIYNYKTCELHFDILEEFLEDIRGDFSVQLVDIVTHLLLKDQRKRMTFKELITRL
jgi:hypothetical protein